MNDIILVSAMTLGAINGVQAQAMPQDLEPVNTYEQLVIRNVNTVIHGIPGKPEVRNFSTLSTSNKALVFSLGRIGSASLGGEVTAGIGVTKRRFQSIIGNTHTPRTVQLQVNFSRSF